jgi:UDP-3-O-[3-hydroxymyristoyl] N-acetylglucosamine deacetylase/3-hydroxyacyl-[acyl-carrier-protein] dehydratase
MITRRSTFDLFGSLKDDGARMAGTTRRERTIDRAVAVQGVGFLTGADVQVRFKPADPGSGVRFIRVDLPDNPEVEARIDFVEPRDRRTTIRRGEAIVEMVEHVMAALSGLRIDNCTIEIDAAETPGCDGSSKAFVDALSCATIVEQTKIRDRLVIDRPVAVREGAATLSAYPSAGDTLVAAYHLDYGATPIGRQSYWAEITPHVFRSELAPSRTFLLEKEAEALKQMGIGSRTTPRDLLVFGPDGPIDNELRYPDECVRHKLLDLIGDLSLLGKDIAGHVVAFRSGHKLNAALARALIREISSGSIESNHVPARETIESIESASLDNAKPSIRPAEPCRHTNTTLDIGSILKLLPHRFPFLLVDRVLELEPDRRIVAIKNVSYNEPFFPGHWPDRPIMPGVLLVEALAQAAGIMLSSRIDSKRGTALMVGINHVRIRRPVVPGDQLTLEVNVIKGDARSVYVQGAARVGTKVVAEAKIRFMYLDRGVAA